MRSSCVTVPNDFTTFRMEFQFSTIASMCVFRSSSWQCSTYCGFHHLIFLMQCRSFCVWLGSSVGKFRWECFDLVDNERCKVHVSPWLVEWSHHVCNGITWCDKGHWWVCPIAETSLLRLVMFHACRMPSTCFFRGADFFFLSFFHLRGNPVFRPVAAKNPLGC
jgi:hypothetical protein